ncbi:MAG: 3-dehydroquinate synthase family protein [Anaerolineae bacterium]
MLAMVDASVGGKVGVDLPQGKNLVGAFKQPEMVVIDPRVLSTLPVEEFRAGMAEVIKHGIIDAPELFATLEERSREYEVGSRESFTPSLYAPSASLLLTPYSVLPETIMVKVKVVQEDPFEQGRRAVLNLGHTFAHAFERLANFQLRHGEAVAMGLACAARLSHRLGHCPAETVDRIVNLLQQVGPSPKAAALSSHAEVWAAMGSDKTAGTHPAFHSAPRPRRRGHF